MYIVKKRDLNQNWVDMLHAQHGHIAFEYYKILKEREGKNNVILLQQ